MSFLKRTLRQMHSLDESRMTEGARGYGSLGYSAGQRSVNIMREYFILHAVALVVATVVDNIILLLQLMLTFDSVVSTKINVYCLQHKWGVLLQVLLTLHRLLLHSIKLPSILYWLQLHLLLLLLLSKIQIVVVVGATNECCCSSCQKLVA